MSTDPHGGARPPVLAIVGPTAVGKTAVACLVAERVRGEIVSADSRQIYRGMDIGTSKPNRCELVRTPHHLIDIVDPSERYDASRFAADAEQAIRDLLHGGATPIIVGGTGFYVLSLFEGLFDGPGRNPEMRALLEEDAEQLGPRVLHERLADVDPDSAARLHPNDTVRVVRALEVYEATGRPLSEWHDAGRRSPAFRPFYVVLTARRRVLYERIDSRVDRMMDEGLLEEVGRLLASGMLSPEMPAADALGYRELIQVISGEKDARQAVEEIKRNTRRYAKRQLTWFSRTAAAATIDMGTTPVDEAAERIVSTWESRAA